LVRKEAALAEVLKLKIENHIDHFVADVSGFPGSKNAHLKPVYIQNVQVNPSSHKGFADERSLREEPSLKNFI
jgi:hypothetical protein